MAGEPSERPEAADATRRFVLLAPKQVPERFARWNRVHGAPSGRELPRWARHVIPWPIQLRRMGPFAIQLNSTGEA